MRSYLLKRLFDIVFSLLILVIFSPILVVAILLVWLQDFKNPFFLAKRVSRGGGEFTMIKVRSMVVGAEQTGVNSTSSNDMRITKIGQFIRRFKIDELSQFFNVLLGDMSVVGPRPNTRTWGVDLYTKVEYGLLKVRPGVTDLSSIVFSDEGEILKDFPNVDESYNSLIRPWKSRLGLLYIENQNLALDIKIVWLTALAVISRKQALAGVEKILDYLNGSDDLKAVCRRNQKLVHSEPPGI